jgi:hypothetical protein
MNSDHYKFLIIDQGILAFIINSTINAAIGYVIYISRLTLPLWGMTSIAGDIIIMTFLLTVIVSYLVTLATYKKIKNGRLEKATWRRLSNQFLGILPANTFLRAMILAVLFTIILVPIVIATLAALGINEMTIMTFVIFKGTLAGFLGIIVAPLSAVCAFGDE